MTHIPGHVGTVDVGGNTPFTGDLFNPDGTFFGTLVQRPSGRLFISTQTATGTTNLTEFRGGSFLTAFNEGITLDANGQIVSSRDLPLPTGGGDGTTSFASTQAAQTQAEAFARGEREAAEAFRAEQDRLGREAAAEQNRLAEESAQQRNRVNVLRDLIDTFIGAQTTAAGTLANLQPDAFAFAAAQRNIPVFGQTPQAAFSGSLQEFIDRPVPQIDDEASVQQLNQAISTIQGANVPQAPSVFGPTGGLAHGGFIPRGTNATFRVGEPDPITGAARPEFMTISNAGVTVTPNPLTPVRGGLQGGGAFGFQPLDFDTESLFPALGTLFGGLGINRVPTAIEPFGGPERTITRTRGGVGTTSTQPRSTGLSFPSFGAPRGEQAFGPELFQTLGTTPAFIRGPQGAIFRVQDGQILPVFDQGVVDKIGNAVVQVADPRAFGTTGREFTLPQFQNLQTQTGAPVPAFGPTGGIIREPTTGAILPDPFKVAGLLRRMAQTNPTGFQLILSAYAKAGIPPQALEAEVLSATVSGLGRGQTGGLVGLR